MPIKPVVTAYHTTIHGPSIGYRMSQIFLSQFEFCRFAMPFPVTLFHEAEAVVLDRSLPWAGSDAAPRPYWVPPLGPAASWQGAILDSLPGHENRGHPSWTS